MYAVIEASGRQERVTQGETLRIDLMSDRKVGQTITFARVLLVGGDTVRVGSPYVEGANLGATVIDMGPDGGGVKGDKIRVFKKRRRQGYHKTIGHRQRYTLVRVDEISAATGD